MSSLEVEILACGQKEYQLQKLLEVQLLWCTVVMHTLNVAKNDDLEVQDNRIPGLTQNFLAL